MIITDNISKQFGSDYLFEGINISFSPGERYGLIGANGSGKSTFMKILSGELESSSGTVKIDKKERISTLKQNQYAYEDMKIIDCVILGYKELWDINVEKERIYSLPEMSEEESLKVSDLEIRFSDLDGYTAEADANKLLVGLGIPIESHEKKMSSVEPGLKLRVLLAQALFGNPDILLLDEPTNNLDLDSIRWLENILRRSESTMIIISHDRKFLNNICSNIADLDYGEIRLYPGNYDNFMFASTQARQQLIDENKKKNWQNALNKVPNEFSTKDWINFVVNELGLVKERQAKEWLKEIELVKMIEKAKHGTWRKTKLKFVEDIYESE